MKKVIVFIAICAVFSVSAQNKFHPGLRAGVNFSKFTQNNDFDPYFGGDVYDDFSFKTDFYFGVQFNLRFTEMYALQPEINYSRQGTRFKGQRHVYDPELMQENVFMVDGDYSVSYLSITVANKLYFVRQFYFMAGPSLDIVMENGRGYDVDIPFDLSVTAGLGFDITKNIGIEARLKKGILPVYDTEGGDSTNFVLSAGVTYSFM